MRVLVVGARPGSLGAALADELVANDYEVVTAGISGEERELDLVAEHSSALREAVAIVDPDHIIVTAGMNRPDPKEEDPWSWYEQHFGVNCIGPMRLLDAWEDLRRWREGRMLGHYVVVSSNSATVPRSGSAAYCASKAALSQALRCKAREYQGGETKGLIAYGYEPGLLAGTPMTDQTARDFPGQPLTRMRGKRLQNGLPAAALAELIAAGLRTGAALNGVMVPFDAGER